jgi:hypothetical protein
MSGEGRRAAAGYLRFLAWAVGAVAVAIALGYLPTRRLAGGAGLAAMLAGCAIGIVGSAVGAIPVAVAAARGSRGATAPLAAMALRFAVALALVLPAALSGLLATVPLLVWVAISYMVLLAVDTRYALAALATSRNAER